MRSCGHDGQKGVGLIIPIPIGDTLRNLLLAWVLTLPVNVPMGAGIFAFGLNLAIRLGLK